jgi:hypothetical protein
MAGRQSQYQKNMERAVKDLLAVIDKDEMLQQMTPEERLHGLDPETQEKLKQLLNHQNGKPT